MTYSKHRFSFAALALAFVSACSFKGASEKLQSAPTPFIVSPVTAVSVETVASDPEYGFATAKTFHLKACLQDAATMAPLPGQPVSLTQNQTPLALQSDEQGCVYWNESFTFQSLAAEQFLSLPRSLILHGVSVALPLLFNPWTETSQSLVDLRTFSATGVPPVDSAEVEDALSGKRRFSLVDRFSPSGSNLVLETFALSPLQQGTDHVTYSVSGKIKALRYRPDGSTQDLPVQRGRLEAQVVFFETVGTEQPHFLGETPVFVLETEQSIFRGEAKATFSGKHREGAQTLALLVIKPTPENKAGMLPVESVLSLKSVRDPVSTTPVRATGSLSAHLRPIASQPHALSSVPSASGFIAPDGARGSFNGEAHFDAAKSEVTVAFSALVLLRDALTGAKIERRPFEVLVSDSPDWPEGVTGTQALSLSDGEVRIDGHLTYSELSAEERYYKKYLLVRGLESPYQGITRAVEVYLNPWQRGELFFRDKQRHGTPTLVANASPLVGGLVIPNYTAVFRKRDFQLDKNLRLTVLRHYDLTLKPAFTRNAFSGEIKPLPLRPGTRFRLKVTWVDPSSAPAVSNRSAFLAAYETEVAVGAAGEINSPLVLAVDFTQQTRLDLRTDIRIQLFPLTTEAGTLQPGSLTAGFVANPGLHDSTSGQTVSDDPSHRGALAAVEPKYLRTLSLGSGIASIIEAPLEESPLDALVRNWKAHGPLTTIALGNSLPSGWVGLDSSAAFANEKETAKKLRALFSKGIDVPKQGAQILALFCDSLRSLPAIDSKRCKDEPGQFFHLSQYTLVDSIVDPTVQIAHVHTPQVILGKAYFNEVLRSSRTSEVDKDSTHWINGAGSKVGLEFNGNGASVHTVLNKEFEWYRLHEASVGDSQRARKSIGKQITLLQEEVTLRFKAHLRKCFLVRPLRFLQAISQSSKAPLDSVLVCSDPELPSSEWTEESWFSLREQPQAMHSVHTDVRSAEEQGFTKLLRGKKAYEEFTQMLGDETRLYEFEKIEPFFDGNDSMGSLGNFTDTQLNRLTLDGGIFPGVLNYDESSSLLWREPQIARYAELCHKAFISGKTVSEAESEVGAKYCRCFYETAARRWSHDAFLRNAIGFEKELESSGEENQCRVFAKGGP
jgi:hypothetical protein